MPTDLDQRVGAFLIERAQITVGVGPVAFQLDRVPDQLVTLGIVPALEQPDPHRMRTDQHPPIDRLHHLRLLDRTRVIEPVDEARQRRREGLDVLVDRQAAPHTLELVELTVGLRSMSHARQTLHMRRRGRARLPRHLDRPQAA